MGRVDNVEVLHVVQFVSAFLSAIAFRAACDRDNSFKRFFHGESIMSPRANNSIQRHDAILNPCSVRTNLKIHPLGRLCFGL